MSPAPPRSLADGLVVWSFGHAPLFLPLPRAVHGRACGCPPPHTPAPPLSALSPPFADLAHSQTRQDDDGGGDAAGGKRPRLVWTPQLHRRFVDAVQHLGINAAVPKTIMQLMNVEGLTRENVASHLQKYRLYLKRLSNNP